MKNLIITLVTSLLITATPLAMSMAAYIGNAHSMKFHAEGCRWEQKISPANRVVFDTRDEAVEAGYIPCKVCRP
jgi:methylphosphotriester-DNA--protein-cysteine methyltransferase